MNHLERSAAVSDMIELLHLLAISRIASRTAGCDADEPPAKSPAGRLAAVALHEGFPLVDGFPSALFLFAVPMAISVIPPMDHRTDDLLFNIGTGSILVAIAVIILWVYQSLDDWLFRLGKRPFMRKKHR